MANEKFTCALALARLLERLPAAKNSLVDAARAETWLAPQATPFDSSRFAAWRPHTPSMGAAGSVPGPAARQQRPSDWLEGGIPDDN